MSFGPCAPWITGDDVLDCGALEGVGTDASVLDAVAESASAILYYATAGLFPGECSRTVRPCRDACGCFARSSGASYRWTSTPWGWAWLAADGCGDRCGCGSTSVVKLAGSPVRSITSVKVDGVALVAGDYRLDRGRYLVRLSDPGPPVVRHSWPACQDLTLADTEEGTFSIAYTWGADPPAAGVAAAVALARELWVACNGGTCQLPGRVTRVVRQGVTIERATSIAGMILEGSTGLPAVDAFIAAANPRGARKRPAVFSPDVRGYGLRAG